VLFALQAIGLQTDALALAYEYTNVWVGLASGDLLR
jgi:hypothetical protein